MTLGTGCVNSQKRIQDSIYVLAERPQKVPLMIDGSPKPCPECASIDGQKMWKFTERDFKSDKEKHIEKDDYIDYLLSLVEPTKK